MGQCVSKESRLNDDDKEHPEQQNAAVGQAALNIPADQAARRSSNALRISEDDETDHCEGDEAKDSSKHVREKERVSLKETLIRAMSNPNVQVIDPEEVRRLRQRLEQTEWELMDVKTLTSSEVYQLLAAIMKEIDDFEEAQLSFSNNRYSQDGVVGGGKSESTQTDQTQIANKIFQMLMRFRQQGHSIYNDVNDEVIAQSGLDSQTKKWLTNEFTRASIVRPARHSISAGTTDVKTLNPAAYEIVMRPEPPLGMDRISAEALLCEDFDVFDYPVDQLVLASIKIFDLGNTLHSCEVDPRALLELVDNICQGYVATNPFHNVFHAVDVLHSCFIILRHADFDIIMQPWQKLGLFLAAIAHDVGHPGTNNAFQVNTASKLALLYNDQSVLENHHAATLYRIIAEHGEGAFRNLKPYARSDMRGVILTSIMATDMKFHFDLVAKGDMTFEKIKMYKKHALGSQIDATDVRHSFSTSASTAVEEARKKEVKLALSLILHCADINNVYKKWPAARRWSDLVVEEFYAQGDLERQLRLPISPFMDRTRDSQSQMSLNFIDFIAGPLVACLADAFHPLEFMLRNMVDVRGNWCVIRKKELLSLANSADAEQQLALLRSRENEFVRNYVSRVMHQRNSVTRTFAMLSAGQNPFTQLARRNSSILARDVELVNNAANSNSKGTASGDKSKSENEMRRSSSAEDVFNRGPSRQWMMMPAQPNLHSL